VAITERGAEIRGTSPEKNSERSKAVDAAILSIEKQFGRGSIMRLGSSERQNVDVIPTGSIALDLALGVGGIPRGRMTEIFGPESSGKTTLCQHVLAEAQKRGGVVAFIDVEHALDPGYARACGVNVDELLVSQPDTGEDALQITETLIRSGGVDCVVLDSVAALVPKAEIEGDIGDSFVGIQARLMSQALRKLAGAVNRSNTALVFTNQLREKIGVMFGNPEVTPGGRALKFYASVRLDIRRVETIKVGTDSVGNRVRVKVVKNKVAPPFRVAEFDIMFGEGISREGGLLDVGVAMDIVAKTGAWFTFGETRLGQGREAAKEFLKANADVSAEVEKQIRAKMSEVSLPVEGIEPAPNAWRRERPDSSVTPPRRTRLSCSTRPHVSWNYGLARSTRSASTSLPRRFRRRWSRAPSSACSSSGGWTTGPSRRPGSSRAIGPGRAARWRFDASWPSRGSTARRWTKSWPSATRPAGRITTTKRAAGDRGAGAPTKSRRNGSSRRAAPPCSGSMTRAPGASAPMPSWRATASTRTFVARSAPSLRRLTPAWTTDEALLRLPSTLGAPGEGCQCCNARAGLLQLAPRRPPNQ
jgi:recombination protein RecA